MRMEALCMLIAQQRRVPHTGPGRLRQRLIAYRRTLAPDAARVLHAAPRAPAEPALGAQSHRLRPARGSCTERGVRRGAGEPHRRVAAHGGAACVRRWCWSVPLLLPDGAHTLTTSGAV